MKKNKIVILVLLLLLTTGCTKTLKDDKNKVVTNIETGQSLTSNILCRPTEDKIIELYKNNKVDLDKIPECSNLSLTKGEYEDLWTNIFVKPLAVFIVYLNNFLNNPALAIIIITIIIRAIAFPITRKTALQSELIKKAQPELNKLEKKYAGKTDQDSVFKKSQEMSLIYKKYNINPLSGCVFALLQLPLFFAFLEAINRIPVVFEYEYLTLQMGTTPWVGLIDKGNFGFIVLVGLIAITTYFSINMNKTTATSENDPMKGMTTVMTVMIIVMSLFMPTALGIYWIVSNLFTILQNVLVKRSKEANG